MNAVSHWTLVEPYLDEVSIYDGEKVFLDAFLKLPTASQNLLAAWWAQSEIRNGGFDQFFGNSTGVLAPEAAAGFRAIGMPLAAEAMEMAIAWFGDEYPRDRDIREEALDGIDLEQDPTDEEFWRLLNEEAGGFDDAADAYAAKAIQ